MEGDDHIHREGGLIAVDVPQLKPKALIAVLSGGLAAFFYHVGLQIEADDIGLHPLHGGEVVIDHKGEVGFAAAEVNDIDALPAQFADLIVQHLQKAVYLAVFVVHGPDHLPLPGEDAHVHQRRHVGPLGDQIILLPVVAAVGGGRANAGATPSGGGQPLAFIGTLPLFGEKQHMLPPLGPAVDLKEMPLYQLGAPPGQVFQRQVFMEHLLVGVAGDLPLLPNRLHRQLLIRLAFARRLADNKPLQPRGSHLLYVFQ